MMTLADRIAEWGITANAEWDADYVSEDDMWDDAASHWQVTLTRTHPANPNDTRAITVPFHQGSAHTKPPTARDVLQCLLSDTSGLDGSFEEWAANYGYDTDSRKAYATFQVILEQTQKLASFLDNHDGHGHLDLWLYETDNE